MYELKVRAAFDSAHFLKGYNGKCANIHGHRWIMEAELSKPELIADGQQRGMIEDFGDIKKHIRDLANSFDHALIYEENSLRAETVAALEVEGFRLIAVPFRPTAECFAKYFYEELRRLGEPVIRMTVYETPDNCASYREEL